LSLILACRILKLTDLFPTLDRNQAAALLLLTNLAPFPFSQRYFDLNDEKEKQIKALLLSLSF
jgi:hypothetical protein